MVTITVISKDGRHYGELQKDIDGPSRTSSSASTEPVLRQYVASYIKYRRGNSQRRLDERRKTLRSVFINMRTQRDRRKRYGQRNTDKRRSGFTSIDTYT